MKYNFLYNISTFLVFCLISSCQNSDTYLDLNNNGKKDVYEDPKLDSYIRAESIVAELSVVEKIAQLVRDKKIDGIRDLRDESNREGIRVVIELRKSVEPETVRRQLYKLTSIESSFGFNSLALVENKPKLLNLKEFISEFTKFREYKKKK